MLNKFNPRKQPVMFGFLIGVGLLGLLGISMLIWAPATLGPFGITVWFGALAVAVALILSASLYLLKRTFKIGKKEVRGASALRQGILIGVWLVGVVALNSLRQLGVGDIVLISLLLILIEIYFRKSQ